MIELAFLDNILMLDPELDIDNNTFVGFDNIRKSMAENDAAQIMYSFDLSVVVSCRICKLYHTRELKQKTNHRLYAVAGHTMEIIMTSFPSVFLCCWSPLILTTSITLVTFVDSIFAKQ